MAGGMRGFAKLIGRFVRDESGATAIEYALVAVGISIAIAGSVQGVRDALISGFYNRLVEPFNP